MSFAPLVSIVIPVYNGADYMRQAIDSALAQTYENCEVLVVNDGSRDNGETDRIAREYGDRIRYLHKANGGVATALNAGIRAMRGEYFSWLSHDDVYLPHKVAAQIAFMDRFELRDAAVYSDYELIDASGRVFGKVTPPSVAPEGMFRHLYNDQCLHGCTLLIPRQALLDAGGFPEELPSTQDYELWLSLCRRIPFVLQRETLIYSRQHAAQGSRSLSSHARDVRDFYFRHLPELVVYGSENVALPDRRQREQALLDEALSQRLAQGDAGPVVDTLAFALARTHGAAKLKLLRRVALFFLRKLYHKLPEPLRLKLARFKPKSMQSDAPRAEGGLDFSAFYHTNGFDGTESVSGAGSTLFLTRVLRRELPLLLRRHGIASLLDIPCGDFHWMRHVDLEGIAYTGGDIVPELVARNQARFGAWPDAQSGDGGRRFLHLNAMTGPLPEADCIMCRDCLVHMPLADALAALRTFKSSGATWLLLTTFTERVENPELGAGEWRPLNMCLAPFNLPQPRELLVERCTEAGGLFGDKALGLWHRDDLAHIQL